MEQLKERKVKGQLPPAKAGSFHAKNFMILYKLTDSKRETYGNFKWELGKKHEKPIITSPQLCSKEVFHAYRNLNLALILNPIHADIRSPLLFKAEGEIITEDWGKVGCKSLTLTEQLELPEWYVDKKLQLKVLCQFAILCAEAVLEYFEFKFPNDDRPRKAIEAAKAYIKNPNVAADAADAAAKAAYVAYAAASAASAAANAADVAASAASVAAYAAAHAAADVAYVAYAAASAAANAADVAAIDFSLMADKAVKIMLEESR